MIGVKLIYLAVVAVALSVAVILQPGFTGFFAFVEGANSRLEIWDSSEAMGGGMNAFINEPVFFYANFSNLTTSGPLNGSGIYCDISFNVSGSLTSAIPMTFNQTSLLYEYNRTFLNIGNYSWNVTCNGSSAGHDLLNVTDGDGLMVYRYEWWNNAWNYRIKIGVVNGDTNVTEWPIERHVNFSDVLSQLNIIGKTFDPNSTRIVEYNSTGGLMHELPSQFDKGDYYNESENAEGTVIYNLNGTTAADATRSFYIYFDLIENGAKTSPNYATNLSYYWIGDEITLNNSRLEFYFDTNRTQNTSGIYRANFLGQGTQRFFFVGDSGKTVEYTQLSNGTHNFSFDLTENTTFVEGPVRLTVIQEGNEIEFGNTSRVTGKGKIIKKYYIYNKAGPEVLGTWIKVEQNFTNTDSSPIARNSTPAGALTFDIERGWLGIGIGDPANFLGNANDPYSWYLALSIDSEIVGMVNINESVSEFFVTNHTASGRIGIELDNRSIGPGVSITEKAALYLGRGGTNEFLGIKDALQSPPSITLGNSENRLLFSSVGTDYDFYNRNESIFLTVNVTYDPYRHNKFVNITLNNATASTSDDITLVMYDDGTHWDLNASDNVFTNLYNISVDANTGYWNTTAYLYDVDGLLLNTSLKNITITDELYVNTTVVNIYGDVYRKTTANVYVLNYRQDVWHPNAELLNCTVTEGAILLSVVPQGNITDYGNGSYFVDFTAPNHFGNFVLNCTATKSGNLGSGIDNFFAEEISTNISIALTPNNFTAENVTWISNQSFMVMVNATNLANGTAYNATIHLDLPDNFTANSTSSLCPTGIVPIADSCLRDFNITILATTAPANFSIRINITWDNKMGTSDFNETFLNVSVEPTYVLDIVEDNITSFAAAGLLKNIENLTVRSLGNAPLSNITFNITGFGGNFNFTFIPVNFSSLYAGDVSPVIINLLVNSPFDPGDYSGLLNVTSVYGGYKEIDVNITVSGTNMSLNISSNNFTADNITYFSDQNFSIFINTTNIGNATAFDVNITLNFSSTYLNTTNSSNYHCGDIPKSQFCAGNFILLVSNGTPSGIYTVNISSVWNNPEIGISSNWTIVNITVLSNVNLTIPEDEVKDNVTHGTTVLLGNFTLVSTGNDPVTDMEFLIQDIAGQIGDFNITINPNITETLGGTLDPGSVITVNVTLGVPHAYEPGVYGGLLNVSSSNGGYKDISIEVTIPSSRTWYVQDPVGLFCQHAQSPSYGLMCNVTINNTGNSNITFNITPQTTPQSMLNYTWTSAVDFMVPKQTTFQYNVTYNVTGAPLENYYANYTISAVSGSPAFQNLTTWLTKWVKPSIIASVSSTNISQTGNLEIRGYVTSDSGRPILYSNISVTSPDNTTYNITMRRIGVATDPYEYLIGFPYDAVYDLTWGNSTIRGNYTFGIFSIDDLTLNNTENGSFYAYVKLSINLDTGRINQEYFQGESGSILFSATDASGSPLNGVNVSISVKNPTDRFVNVNDNDFLTNSQGEPPAYPSFDLLSDSPVGTYNITCNSWYNDTAIGQIAVDTTVSNFSVVTRSPWTLYLDLESPAQVSTREHHHVFAIISNGITNIDPDNINVSLYDPLDNLIIDSQSMTRESTGRYNMFYNTSISLNTGVWRWVVSIEKDGYVITKDVYSRLVGGLFDARNITIIDNTVPTLEISVIVENTGSTPEDAIVEWNLTRTDTGERVAGSGGGDTIRIDPESTRTYTVNPTTTYVGEHKITFIVTYSGSEKAGAYEYFITEPEPSKPPSKPPSGPSDDGPSEPAPLPAPIGVPEIKIIEYPEEVATEAGWSQYPSVTVNNTGETILRNIKMDLLSIPDSWYNVTPKLVPLLKIGETKTFVINLLVSQDTEAKKYYGTINASANGTYDEKLFAVIVFGSREELVKYQLDKLKEEFEYFKEDVNATEKEGKLDLSRVYGIIEEIHHQIELTEGYLDAKMFDEALDSVTTGWRLLERGRELLKSAPPLSPATIFIIPDWMVTISMILVIVILVLIILMTKYKKKLNQIFRRKAPEIGFEKEKIGGGGPALKSYSTEHAEATRKDAERQKVKKIIVLLEKEYKEGIISEKAFNDLRVRNVKKLKELGGTV